MRYVVFGACPYPVLQVLPKMAVVHQRGATYVRGEAAVLDQARDWGLLEDVDSTGQAWPSRNLVLVDPAESRRVAVQALEVLPDYLEVLRDAVADLEVCHNDVVACARHGFPWARVRHAVVGGWLMDLGLAQVAGLASRPQALSSWRVVGFEGLADPGTECGVRIQWGTTAVLGEFWAGNRPTTLKLPVNLERSEVDGLAAVALAGETRPVDHPPRIVSKLRYLGLLGVSGTGMLRPALPVLAPPEWASLETCVLGWAKRLYGACHAATPFAGDARGEVLRLVFFRCLLSTAYAAAEEAGALPEVQGFPPRDRGFWMLLEPVSSQLVGRDPGAS